MEPEDLEDPIWDKQKGETPTQHDWFVEFIDFPGYSLKGFHEYLEGSYQESLKVTEVEVKIPSYNMIKKWSSHNLWTKRKKASRDFDKNEEKEKLKKIKEKSKLTNFRKKQKIETGILRKMEDGLYEDVPLSQLNQGAQAYVTLNEDDLKELGESTEDIKVELTADVEATTKQEHIVDMSNPEVRQNIDSFFKNLTEDKP